MKLKRLKIYSEIEQSILAFETVIRKYQELVSMSGMMSCMNYETSSGGKVTHTGRACVITPSRSDTVCDVELCARRSLTPSEFAYFEKYYQSTQLLVLNRQEQREMGGNPFFVEHLQSFVLDRRAQVEVFDSGVREKLGAELIRARIFPMNIYIASVDTSKTMVRGTAVRRGGKGIHLVTSQRNKPRTVCKRAA
jgi:hypothetical protein